MDRSAISRSVLGGELFSAVNSCKLLIVGAGGIGCELLKNVALAGFKDIHVIDLDTIELTNLNRQFLFQQQHVGKSKAKVASESVLAFNPSLNITAYHANIFDEQFNLRFFEQFDLVMNALDNLKARNHVNRMCLAAKKPLVESGSAGYLGQVTVIKKGVTECYECVPKPPPKQYPACTIRNTPSTIVHCIVWAKFLFTHLYGEADHENDVAPNPDDPELGADKPSDTNGDEEQSRMNTRQWAEANQFDPQRLLEKLFVRDISVLLSMASLWTKRAKPHVLDLDSLTKGLPSTTSGQADDVLPDQRVWNLQECIQKFLSSAAELKRRFLACSPGDYLTWDKDDDIAMDFVCAAANLRAQVFGIPLRSRFDVKSMAGNIIPAIATTNAVVAGLIVNEAFKILRNNLDQCRAVYLSRSVMGGNKLVNPLAIPRPNPKCYVCSERPTVTIKLDVTVVTVETLAESILKKDLSLVTPEVVLATGQEVIGIPDDEDDLAVMLRKVYPRPLSSFGIVDGTSCTVTDDLQKDFKLTLVFRHSPQTDPDVPYEILGGSMTDENESGKDNQQEGNGSEKRKHAEQGDDVTTESSSGPEDGLLAKKKSKV
eukprot:m.85133 g.85133  ORF g.85133 m.85133 type:complete len:600 (-) comp14413_c0_seq6:138-1937(-)